MQNRLLVGLERQQRFVAIGIDAADQRKFRPVVVETNGRSTLLVGLLQRLADIAQCNRPIHVNQFAVLSQHVEKLAKILIRHFDLQHPLMLSRLARPTAV